MSAPAEKIRFSRRTVVKGGALIVGFALTGRETSAWAQGITGAPRRLDTKEVDAFLAVNGDGSVTVYCGKVDLGQGLRIAIPQIAAEELGIGIEKIRYIEGDTALTPNRSRIPRATPSSANPCRVPTWRPNAWEQPPTFMTSLCRVCSMPA